MKNYKRIRLWVCIVTLWIPQVILGQDAEKLFVLEKPLGGSIIQVYWDNKNEQGHVQLISPDGKSYKGENLGESYKEQKGLTWFALPRLMAGKWQVKVQGTELGQVQLKIGKLPTYIGIQRFNSFQLDKNYFKINWDIKDAVGDIEFTVFLSKDKEALDGTEVVRFIGQGAGEKNITIEDVEVGKYYLLLKVVDVLEIPAYSYSKEAFWIESKGS